jgi:hypothetical protein
LVTFEYPPVPPALIACTRKRYVVPFVNPAIVCVVAVELNVIGDHGK